jgi:hypothetical protein
MIEMGIKNYVKLVKASTHYTKLNGTYMNEGAKHEKCLRIHTVS